MSEPNENITPEFCRRLMGWCEYTFMARDVFIACLCERFGGEISQIEKSFDPRHKLYLELSEELSAEHNAIKKFAQSCNLRPDGLPWFGDIEVIYCEAFGT